MRKISVVLLSVVIVGSNMVLPFSQYTSSFVGLSSAEAARGGRVTRSGPRGSVSRSAVAGPRGGAARTTVRTPHGTRSRTVAATRPAYRHPVHHGRPVHYDRYDRYYSGGAVLAAGVAGLAIGAMVASIPPSCTTIIRGGIEYRQCGDTYYQQSFKGPDVVYVVVPAP